jgi:spermidine synthase
LIEELDYRATRFGELVLRRRRSPAAPEGTLLEVLLDGEYLMSSVVHESERALARLGLDWAHALAGPVLVGGLGLGYTAAEALELTSGSTDPVVVVEALDTVIAWHRERIVPLGERISTDPRCRLVEDDFFERIARDEGGPWRAILVDIDHSPTSLLHPAHAPFYRREGLADAAARLLPGGVFALWSADPIPDELSRDARAVFDAAETVPVDFENPSTGPDRNWILRARRGASRES